MKEYKFKDLDAEHQAEVRSNVGDKAAKKTVWTFVPDYPVSAAAALAWDTSIVIMDDRVDDVLSQIRDAGEVLRPILIDDLDPDSSWMEGHHRSIASEELGLKTIPALVRIK